MSTDTIAFALTVSGVLFLGACALVEAFVWITDLVAERRRKRAAK
jgi:hypothetical protein